MTIKQSGGIFGRNPTFNDVTIEGELTFDGDIDVNSDLKVSGDIEASRLGINTDPAHDIHIKNATAVEIKMEDTGAATAHLIVADGIGLSLRADSAYNDVINVLGGAAHQIVFRTNGADAFIVDAAGNIAFTAGKGIDFSATTGTGTSELFDDYEEGTWTPAFSGGDYSFTYNKQKGSYTKIGNRVFIDCVLYVHPTTGPSGSVDGDLEIINLPYTFNKQNDVEVVGGVAHFKQLFMSTVEVLAARLDDGGTSFKLYDTLATNYPELAYVQASDVAANTRIRIQFSYPTNG